MNKGEKKSIDLIVHTSTMREGSVIRVNREANSVLAELHRATGLSISHIASQMIIQGENFINIIEEE